MVFVRALLGRCIAFALDRATMDQDRAFATRFDAAQDGQKLVHVMAVDRADIIEAQFFEQRAGQTLAGYQLTRAFGPFTDGWRHQCLHSFGKRFHGCRGGGIEAGQISRHRADRRSNGHFVVV